MKWPFAWQMKIDWGKSSDNTATSKVQKGEINDEQKLKRSEGEKQKV
jgi:hypothetical protein